VATREYPLFLLLPTPYSRYVVSHLGEVHRVGQSKPLQAVAHHRTGHLRVKLYFGRPGHRKQVYGKDCPASKDAYVHVLVALAYHGPPPFPDALVRHLDGNPRNNRPENLAWGTRRENYDDLLRHRAEASAEAEAELAGPEPTYVPDPELGW
jgi:hypothetical protein